MESYSKNSKKNQDPKKGSSENSLTAVIAIMAVIALLMMAFR